MPQLPSTGQHEDPVRPVFHAEVTFKPMGPVLVLGLDPMAQTIGVCINGKTESSTAPGTCSSPCSATSPA